MILKMSLPQTTNVCIDFKGQKLENVFYYQAQVEKDSISAYTMYKTQEHTDTTSKHHKS